MHSLSTFGARTNHEQTWIQKTHHGPDLVEATTFPLIVLFVPSHGAYIQMSFCFGSPKIPKIRTPAIVKAHNFLCKLPIEMKYEANL
jgi:hypothetical protein